MDDALERLAELSELPIGDHPAVFEYVHGQLTLALGDLAADDHGRPAGQPGRPGS